MKFRKAVLLVNAVVASTLPIAAQIEDRTGSVIQQNSAAVTDIINLCYTLGAICGLIGGMLTYSKMNSGQTDSYEAIKNWFVACIALLLLPQLAASIMNAYIG